MVTESKLIERLREILSTSNLNTTTTSIVRKRLEEDFGIDLSERKAFIREQVDVYMQSQFENVGENEEEINEEGVAEEREGGEEAEEDKEEEAAATDGCSEVQKRIRNSQLTFPYSVFGEKIASQGPVPKEKLQKQDKDEATPQRSAPKERKRKQNKDDDEEEPKRKEKRRMGGTSGLLAPVKLSDALMKFLGTGESMLPRSNVVKRIWDYIKLNNLQDPSDKRQIICDEKLKELFNVETFVGFTVAKLLTAHLVKA